MQVSSEMDRKVEMLQASVDLWYVLSTQQNGLCIDPAKEPKMLRALIWPSVNLVDGFVLNDCPQRNLTKTVFFSEILSYCLVSAGLLHLDKK